MSSPSPRRPALALRGWVSSRSRRRPWTGLDPQREIAPRRESIQDFGDSAFLVHDLLAPAECAALRAALAGQTWVPVGQNGMARGFDPQRDAVGSHRATSFEPRVADLL